MQPTMMSIIDHIEQDPVLTRFEKIPVAVFAEPDVASVMVAKEIKKLIKEKQKEKKKCVLGFPTGSTPVGLYEELIRMHTREGLSFKNVVTFNTDEYFPMDSRDIHSYERFMREHLFDHIDIPGENIHIPDGTVPLNEVQKYCADYESMIRKAGGIDLQILGIGRTGHIGFNEPGSYKESRTRLIILDYMTMSDAASDFFGAENVPRRAITMGIGTFFEAKRIILMAFGEGKAGVIKETVEGPVRDAVPASFLQTHPNAMVIIGEAAAAELTRYKTPWLVGECDWTSRMIRKAVVWLCQKVSKPILKLTNRDYNDNGMGDLAAEYSSAYQINLKVFNDLQHTITGWPGGKPDADDSKRPERAKPFPKRVLIFSPHPDDDVISMGGTFIRLVDHGNEVHVAYQTSGNIAVFDDDVIRFADFVSDYQFSFGAENSDFEHLFKKVQESIQNKKPGQIDSEEVQEVKKLIRRAEAKAACRFVGLPEKNVHFLDLPFYETGTVRKKPVGVEDINITVHLLREIKPHQIYAAGDLSDPHGTHRVCLDAILRAFKIVKNDSWTGDCRVWLYRGAWQEWDISEVDMAVPLSPDEVIRKRKAIFRHQSQKDSALFPGTDEREFWQRAEDRNHATAVLYDKLGMAEYEAFEAFVRHYF